MTYPPRVLLRSPPTDATLLVVDDDPVFRTLLTGVLRDVGHRVLEADTAAQARALADSTTIDLILLDIQLPDRSGIDLARDLDPVPILFVTQHSEVMLVQQAFSDERITTRAVGYIVKPIDPATIHSTVAGALAVAQQLRINQRLLEATTRAAEREKRHLAQELHDELGQALVRMKWDAIAIREHYSDEPALADIRDRTERVVAGIDYVYVVVNRIIDRLQPEVLDTLGLEVAIQKLIEDWNAAMTGCRYALVIQGDCLEDLDKEAAVMVYRLVQEALTNTAKHARAHQVQVHIDARGEQDNHLHLHISDDGVGFDTDMVDPERHGLKGLRERVAALGGTLAIFSQPRGGTLLEMTLPVLGGYGAGHERADPAGPDAEPTPHRR